MECQRGQNPTIMNIHNLIMDIYNWFMDIHKLIMDIHNSTMDMIIGLWISIIQLWISIIRLFMDIHNWFMDMLNWIMDIHKWKAMIIETINFIPWLIGRYDKHNVLICRSVIDKSKIIINFPPSWLNYDIQTILISRKFKAKLLCSYIVHQPPLLDHWNICVRRGVSSQNGGWLKRSSPAECVL